MVIPNTLLVASRGFACKATAADSTWLAVPAVSVAITVRITLPASTVTMSTHVGKKQRSSWRKLALTESAFASYSSTVPAAFSTKVTALADTISLVAPGGNDSGGGGGGGGGGGFAGGGEGDGGGGEGKGGGVAPAGNDVSGGAGGFAGGGGRNGGGLCGGCGGADGGEHSATFVYIKWTCESGDPFRGHSGN